MRMMMTVSSRATDSSGHGSASFPKKDISVTASSFDASQYYHSNRHSTGERSNTVTSQNSLLNEPGRDIREFLECYSLPRVVNILTKNAQGEAYDDDDDDDDENQCQPVLLYRCFESFVKVKAKPFIGKKGKEKLSQTTILHFPEGYPGLFSLIGEKGERQAVAYNSLLQLVREQVCTFLNAATFTAYINIAVNMPGGQYVRTTIHPGQVLRLRAVFQHSERKSKTRAGRSLSLGNGSSNQRDLANRYAQLVDHNNQELYAPLTTKGEFFEVHSSMKSKLCFPGMLDKTGPLAFDKDCLYRLTHLLRRIKLPIKVKLLAGNLPLGLPIDCTDTFILEEKIQEPLLVTCTIPLVTSERATRHKIDYISLNSKALFARTLLGFDSERRLFKSQRIQSAMYFCQNNIENWYREVRLIPNIENIPDECETTNLVKNVEHTCGQCKTAINRCYCSSQTKSTKKWFQHFKLPKLRSSDSSESSNSSSVIKSSHVVRKIEEKFSKKSVNPVKKSASFLFSPKRDSPEDVSLEVVVINNNEPGYNHNNNNSNNNNNNVMALISQYDSLDDQLNEKSKNSKNIYQSDLKKNFENDKPPLITDFNESIYCNIIEINQPDVIPYPSTSESLDGLEKKSFISQKLRNEFQVKTKLTPRRKHKLQLEVGHFQYRDGSTDHVLGDVPYSQVKDNVSQPDEHPYAEIR